MIREFMRTLVSFFLGSALLISSSACVFEENNRTALGEAPPASPRMIEFVTDFGMAWNPGLLPNFRGPLLLSTCYDLKTHAVVQSKYGDQVTTFKWDVKVDIKRPV